MLRQVELNLKARPEIIGRSHFKKCFWKSICTKQSCVQYLFSPSLNSNRFFSENLVEFLLSLTVSNHPNKCVMQDRMCVAIQFLNS